MFCVTSSSIVSTRIKQLVAHKSFTIRKKKFWFCWKGNWIKWGLKVKHLGDPVLLLFEPWEYFPLKEANKWFHQSDKECKLISVCCSVFVGDNIFVIGLVYRTKHRRFTSDVQRSFRCLVESLCWLNPGFGSVCTGISVQHTTTFYQA